MDDGLKLLLDKMVEAIELLSDETAELVDKYHRPYTDGGSLHMIRDRSLALVAVADNMRRVADTVLGKTDRLARSGRQA
jgi:hypothetical protein